jgi:hypothetical protein
MIKIEGSITIGDKYDLAMKITDPIEAQEYFEACVQHTMSFYGKNREDAVSIERHNLGYYAGYYNHETRLRVERLFNCSHPIFREACKHTPTAEEAFKIGLKMGKATRKNP